MFLIVTVPPHSSPTEGGAGVVVASSHTMVCHPGSLFRTSHYQGVSPEAAMNHCLRYSSWW